MGLVGLVGKSTKDGPTERGFNPPYLPDLPYLPYVYTRSILDPIRDRIS